MIVMREPIALKSRRTFLTDTEPFCQRLISNYTMLSAHVSPKDLLFLLTVPPEFPEDLGGTSNTTLQSSFTDARQVTMQVVNNLLNRILLSNQAAFTYQDQVYIQSILNKLGITDVAQFMQQIHRLQEEYQSIATLTKLYQQQTTRQAISQMVEQTLRQEQAASPPPEAEQPQTRRYYLHDEIYHRLQTKALYHKLHTFQQNFAGAETRIENKELKTAEQLRVSQMLTLSELRRESLQTGAVTVYKQENHYELGDLLPVPQTEQQVLAQIAQAALFSTVEHLLASVIERFQGKTDVWLELENSLSQTLENTLSRFESYHSRQTTYRQDADVYEQQRLALYKEEESILRQLSEQHTSSELRVIRQETHGAAGETLYTPAELTHPAPERGEPVSDELRQDAPHIRETQTMLHETMRELRQQQERSETILHSHTQNEPGEVRTEHLTAADEQQPQAAPQEHTAPLSAQDARQHPPSETLLRETMRELQTRQAHSETTLHSHSQAEHTRLRAHDSESELRVLRQELIGAAGETLYTPAELTHPASEQGEPTSDELREDAPHIRETQTMLHETMRELRQQQERAETVWHSHTQSEPGEVRTEHLAAADEPEQKVMISEGDAAAPSPELVRQLTEIDRQNRERYEQMTRMQLEHTVERAPSPDPKRTMRDALRALEQPETVLRELMETPARTEHPAVSPALEAVLSQTDEVTRKIYETVLQYEQNPQAALESGLVQRANASSLNAQVVRQLRESAQMAHPEPDLVRDDTIDAVTPPIAAQEMLEQLRELPLRQAQATHERTVRGKVPIVLRREDNSTYEELIERLEERRTQGNVTQVTHQQITSRTTQEVDINHVNRQVVAQTGEDITTLVNRAMAREMNTITDKVYRQMERKLQNERSRRGRL